MGFLLDKLKKASTVKDTEVLSTSKFFKDKDMVTTEVPMMNVALSGRLDGGLSPGLTMFAGPSKHFKTAFSLLMAKSYLDKYPDAVLLFYDAEFGTPTKYFETFNITLDRVLHTPITDVEQLKIDIMKQLSGIERGDRVIIVLDSIGNLASKKEVDDALDGKTVADMSRAKQIKSLFRMVTPHLTLKDIPMVVVNHTYKEMACLDGGTIVKTIDGNKAIKDIVIGDVVYTNNGTQRVIHCYTPEELPVEDKEYLELEFDDGSTVKCTNNHQFLMKDSSWVAAKDLKIGDHFM